MIKEQIEAQRDARKQLDAPCWIFDEYLLRNGEEFLSRPLPKRYRMRPQKYCFHNTLELVVHSRTLRYCEGYVARIDLPILIHHAWALDAMGNVVDTTLRDVGFSDAAYWGIVFRRAELSLWRDQRATMLMDARGGYDLESWIERDPGFKELADMALRL